MNNIKSFIILFSIVLFFVLFVGGVIPYFLLYILLLAFLIPLIHSLIILNKIKGTVQIPTGTLYAGDKIDIDYQINNYSSFIPYIEIQSPIGATDSKDSPKITTTLNLKNPSSIGNFGIKNGDTMN